MAERNSDSWQDSRSLAKSILRDRIKRRKWLGRLIMFPIAMLGVGFWGIHEWLAGDVWRFVLWWGVCAVATCVVILFALYDALTTFAEERKKNR